MRDPASINKMQSERGSYPTPTSGFHSHLHIHVCIHVDSHTCKQTYLPACTPHTYTWKITMLSTGDNSVFSRLVRLPCPMTGCWGIKLKSLEPLPTSQETNGSIRKLLDAIPTRCRITVTYYCDCSPESKSNKEHTDKTFLIQTENTSNANMVGQGGQNVADSFFPFSDFLHLSKFPLLPNFSKYVI